MKKTSTSNLLQKVQEENLCKKQGLSLKEKRRHNINCISGNNSSTFNTSSV